MKPSQIIRGRWWTTGHNEDRRAQRSDLLPIRVSFTVLALFLTMPSAQVLAGSAVKPVFPDAPWTSTSASIPPGVLAHRMECLLSNTSGDTLRLSVSADSPPVALPDRLRKDIQAGRGRLALRVAGGEGSLVTQPLDGTPTLVPDKPARLNVPLSAEELRRFLDREIRLELPIQHAGRPLPGLAGSSHVNETSPGRYQLSLSCLQVMQLRNPSICKMLLFSPERAYRVSIPTGIGAADVSPKGSNFAEATPLPEAGLAPQVLLLSPLSVDLGTLAVNQPGECSLSLTSWGSSTRIIPLTFSSSDLRAENLPSAIRLEPGQTTRLAFQVAARRSGRVSGKVKIGASGGSVEVTGTAQGDGGGEPPPRPHPDPPPPVPPITLSAEAIDPNTFRIRWKSPGEGFSYSLVCRSVSSPETPARKFDFRGRESLATGRSEYADFRGLPADGTYSFELIVSRNGQIVVSKSLTNKRLTF